MRRFFFFVLLTGLVCHWAYQWFNSPKYLNFVLKNKNKPWASKVLFRTAQFYLLSEDWQKAEVFLERCVSEDFSKRPERASCLYEYGVVMEETRRRGEALELLDKFIDEYPNHPKANIARRKTQILKYGS